MCKQRSPSHPLSFQVSQSTCFHLNYHHLAIFLFRIFMFKAIFVNAAAAVVVPCPAKLRVIVKSGECRQVITKSGETDITRQVDDGYPSITIISPNDSILLTCPKTPELGNSPLKFSDVQFIGWIGCLIKNYS